LPFTGRDASVTTPELHLIGVDPGGTTGVTRLTVPRLSIFGDEPPQIIEWDYFALNGPEAKQATELARYTGETQSLSYKIGPAIVSELWTQDPRFKSTDPEALSPARINAMLELLLYQNLLGDATLTFQPRGIRLSIDEDKLRKMRMYVKHKDIRASTQHAVMGLRRARQSLEFATKLWPEAV